MKFKTALATTILTSAFMPMVALAGVVFEVETTYHSGSPGVETSEMYVDKPNLKMEIISRRDGTASRQQDTAIFRGDRREMVVINHEEQYYMVMDAGVAKRVSNPMNDMMKQLEGHLEGLDPKQREMMENMLKGQGGAVGGPAKRMKNEYRQSGERATKKGYPCVKYEVLRGGEKTQELWVTDWRHIKGRAETEATFKEMAAFWEEMMDSFGGGFMGGDDGPEIDVFAEIGGFPVVTRDFKGGELESESVLQSVTQRDLDPADFEPPAGYKRRSMGPH